MLFAQLTPSAASNTRKPASVWLTTADSFWRSCSRTRICSSMRRKRRSYSSSFGCTTVSARSATRPSAAAPPVALGVGAGETLGHLLYLGDARGIERVELVAVDVDRRVDRPALADEHHELGARRRRARRVVGGLADVRNVDVALFRDRQSADALADRNEHVIGGRADERPQPQHLVREQLVDAGPVESWVGGVQLFDPPLHCTRLH